MILSNTDWIAGYEVTHTIGVVRGNTIRAKHLGKDIAAGLKGIVGGELAGYTEMLTEAREEALARMVKEAEKLNADAVINLRYMTSQVARNAAEILAYGTAVKIKKKR